MYRSCIFCSAALGSNDSIERFPVGRTVAFDAEKGRLWAVCGGCARWNLAPLEERWEAVEDAERLFRDTRLRVQSENVGLAKLPDGTRLVRVGRALAGELAVWRYGGIMRRRRAAYAVAVGVGVGVPVAAVGSLVMGSMAVGVGLLALSQALAMMAQWRPPLQPRSLLPYTGVDVDAQKLRTARFTFTFYSEVSVEVEQDVELPYELEAGQSSSRQELVVLSAEHARTALRRGMAELNAPGAPAHRVQAAVDLLTASGSADDFLRHAAAERIPVDDPALHRGVRQARMLAVEMAVHEELEREAMQGELAALEAAWREAEEIAGIADRLPDLPAPEPPRLGAEG